MKDIIKGRVAIKLGDFINSDEMTPNDYMWERDAEVLARVALVNYDPEFPKKVRPGDVIVAGKGFGHGHLHMSGLIAFRKLGVAAVIAESVVPAWYRGATAAGFSAISCPGITGKVSVGDELEISIKTAQVKNLTTGVTLESEPIPPIIMEILEAGGITPYTTRKVGAAPSR